jgi:hypothetical protein
MLGHDDRAFLERLETCQFHNAVFRHYDHLRAAWSYLQLEDVDEAIGKVGQSIRRFAAHHGHTEKFHVTLTTVWVKLVHAHAARHPHAAFASFIAAHPRLLEKDLPLQFYSRAQLFSDSARVRWIEPDLRALPSPSDGSSRS